MFPTEQEPSQLAPLKESIRDLARLQQAYNPSDELLWVFFNLRVLANDPISLDDFAHQTGLWRAPHRQISPPAVG